MSFEVMFPYKGKNLKRFCKTKTGDIPLTNRPFFKMAAENSNKLKLATIKNVYRH